jgi:putative glutathione S-transferase
MGQLVDGVWQDDTPALRGKGDRFVRKQAKFRNWITPDGAPGPSGTGGFKPEPDRYHLYISHACPWAHRTLIMRRLKGLEEIVSLSITDPLMDDEGWFFSDAPGAIPDFVNGATRLYEIYLKSDPTCSSRVSVPVLWDKQTETIVSNESSEIIRMFNSAFGDLANGADYYPEHLRDQIDPLNDRIYNTVNNGVYRSGFARSQEAYEEAVKELFATLDMLEDRLDAQRYLVGSAITEAEWRLFATLIRFDAVYVGHFKCNLRRIADYPNLSNYVRDLYQQPGIADLVDIDHIKRHYYMSHDSINPLALVPAGPVLDFDRPHDRDRFGL